MSPLRIPIDGLWRCLCPSVDSISVLRSAKFHPLRILSPQTARARKRQFHTSIRASNTSTPNFLTSKAREVDTRRKFYPQTTDDSQKSPLPPRHLRSPGIPSEPRATPLSLLHNHANTHLHDKLRGLLSKQGAYHEIAELVHYLISVRGEKPALIHYDALVRANADAKHGGVDVVRGLLEEMDDLGINGDAGFFHGVLLVLAIHPDFLLRNEIMQRMKERWFGLSPEGWHWLVVGLIRDRQYELAMDKLEQMQSDLVNVQPWLYDIFMFQLCEADELDEAWKLLKYRWEHDRNRVWSSVYYYLLDKFSHGYHYEGTKFIWKVRVQSDIIVPSDGICISVLNLAARYSDPGLATSAMRILSSRRAALAPYHYEALITAYAGFGDLTTAFRLLTIMAKAGVEPTPSTTRPLFLHLSQDPTLPKHAWQTLEQLFDDGHAVPIAAVNVVLESFNAVDQFEDALKLYRKLHTICEAGPDTETFNVLFQGSTRANRKDASMFLASEMHALGIPADNLTYDRLILVCLHQTDYEDAFRYLDEMVQVGADRVEEGTGRVGWWMRKGTAHEMVKTCVKFVDDRVWDVLKEMKKRGLSTESLEIWVEKTWTGPPAAAQDLRARQEERLRQWKAVN